MLKREHPLLLIILVAFLAACGTPATQAPTLAPTLVLPTRVAVLPSATTGVAGGASAGSQPTTAPTVAPTTAPTVARPIASPTITLIPASPTKLPPTATVLVVATATKAGGAATGDPAKGEALFKNGTGDPAVPLCTTCHNVDTPDIKIGPSQKGIATRAGTRVPGQNAVIYLRNSIVNPNTYLVPNEAGHIYSNNGMSLMYQDYGKVLTEAQINDLVAYLMTLK